MTTEKNIDKYFQQVAQIITFEEFKSKIESKKKLLGDLCDEDMCIQLVLNDLNISQNEIKNRPQYPTKKIDQFKTIDEIKKMETEEFVSFYGKIITTSNVIEFKRNDGSVGRVMNLFVIDTTGQIKVNVWDEKTEILNEENIKEEPVVIIRGIIKKIRNSIEVNINFNGIIELNEKNDINIDLKSINISDINKDKQNCILKGKIIEIIPIKKFIKKNSEEGKLKQLIIGDETGKIKLNLWNQQIELNKNLNLNDSILLTHFYINQNNYSKNLELSIETNYKIKKLDYTINYKQQNFKINQIIDSMNEINISGKIIDMSEIKTFIKKDGTEGTVGNIILGDETGKIQLTLWNENTIYLDEFNFNDIVDIKNCASKINSYTQQIELYLTYRSLIEKSSAIIDFKEVITSIKNIKPGHMYNIYGSIKQINRFNEFEFNNETENSDSNSNNKILIEDETGSIEVIFSSYHNELLDQLKTGDKIKITNVFSKKDDLENTILYTNSKSLIN